MKHEESRPQIIRLKETASTNRYMQECLLKGRLPEGSVVVAEYQSAGRGQVGNVWESDPGLNLTFSTVLYPSNISTGEQFILSQIAALAVKETLDAYTDGITIKWPNDIYWQDKKICGMLIENSLMGEQIHSSIIGIGLNINQLFFSNKAPNSVSLYHITGKKQDKEKILTNIRQKLYHYYLLILQGKDEDIRQNYKESLYRKEGFYAYSDSNGSFEASIQDIEPTGHLLLQLRSGELRRYAFKEVTYI
ncbi:biotin--[acetyl-CoA-carboxylase] ligase [Bacteroidia bacterium]|nr:biotin--[acetyl-CoA-carboxylase] ligase [Bacteroidia bacterium]